MTNPLAHAALNPVVAPGSNHPLYIDLLGNLRVSAPVVTPFKLISAATTNATLVKGSAGTLSHVVAMNKSATLGFLKIYDKATIPIVGTDVPVLTYIVPDSVDGAGFVDDLSGGYNFVNGIGIALTGGIADNDTTAVTANDFVVNLGFV